MAKKRDWWLSTVEGWDDKQRDEWLSRGMYG
jgi:hypothetical protein